MKTNVKLKTPQEFTHEGAPAAKIDAEQRLRRTVMACMLFEDTFYEDGESVAVRIARLVKEVRPEFAAACAFEARTKMKLRHVPLLIVREMARIDSHKHLVGPLLRDVIQRPDEITEFLSIYWAEKRQPLSAQVKKGLAAAFQKFNEYQLGKYDRQGDKVRLRDALFLSHSKPVDGVAGYTKELRRSLKTSGVEAARQLNAHEALYRRVVDGRLATPDTWETRLSGGADKAQTFTRLINEKKLGALALLRNLRNMTKAGVSDDLIRHGLRTMNVERVLPFRFITAARYAPHLEDAIEEAMFRCLETAEKLPGKTALLIDHSGSMCTAVSGKSEISRFDAAGALAILLCEVCDQCRVFTFAAHCIEVPPRHGFGMLAAVCAVVNPVGTLLGRAVRHVYSKFPECDRLIVITDEQSADRPGAPQGRGYVINVATHQNGICYGPWVHIDGWSEAVIDFIRQAEAAT